MYYLQLILYPQFLSSLNIFRFLNALLIVAFIYAISCAMMYIITSFGIIYLTKYLGHYGLLVVIIPLNIGCALGINHFENLEKKVGNYPQKPSLGFVPEVV